MLVNTIFYTNAVKVTIVYNNVDVHKVITYPKESMNDAINLYRDWYNKNRDIINQQNIDFTVKIKDCEFI